eukprot:CAMPEP_0117551424 /NCGR_PEP_ID=MMETSP0784-20121206/49185_1 /TAXON_ID=39447 /ORGANISM="" /LENGTH=281 /DNA_ID=CAMNT_0005348465 /DNA_START=61 /DNA_END=903 /DNA_ORIENTATION=-
MACRSANVKTIITADDLADACAEAPQGEAIDIYVEENERWIQSTVDSSDIKGTYRDADDGDEIQVYDGVPVIEEAIGLKAKGNAFVAQKAYSDAVKFYEEALNVLGKCEGFPMLKSEDQQVTSLKATLHANLAQCMLNLELPRRAVEAATKCLQVDASNMKALHRRSLANEELKHYYEALRDAVVLQDLDGGGLDLLVLEKRCEKLWDTHVLLIKATKTRDQLVNGKARFDAVLGKYSLDGGEVAAEVAEWLFKREWSDLVQEVQKQWGMDQEEADAIAKW